MRISDWSSDVCSSDLRLSYGRFYVHRLLCTALRPRQDCAGRRLGGSSSSGGADRASLRRGNGRDTWPGIGGVRIARTGCHADGGHSARQADSGGERKSVVKGKNGTGSVDLGGERRQK